MVGLLLIFLQDSLDNTPHAQEEVETMLQLPVLTSIPRIKRKWTVSLNGVGKNNYTVQMYQDAYSYLLHSMRALTGEKPYSVMVTSATPGEGKSTIAANLAITAAHFGYKTLLIDGDLRRPSLTKMLKVSDAAGLSDLVSGQGELKDLPVEGLKFLGAGSVPDKPAIFWTSREVGKTINFLKKNFDFVVVDSPPVLGIPDAVGISSHVDEIILCVGVEQVDKTLLLRVRKILRQTNRNLVGVVWNKVNETNIYGKYKYQKYYEAKAKSYA
jgi:capsular exopolysaccharide synthesis family protein